MYREAHRTQVRQTIMHYNPPLVIQFRLVKRAPWFGVFELFPRSQFHRNSWRPVSIAALNSGSFMHSLSLLLNIHALIAIRKRLSLQSIVLFNSVRGRYPSRPVSAWGVLAEIHKQSEASLGIASSAFTVPQMPEMTTLRWVHTIRSYLHV